MNKESKNQAFSHRLRFAWSGVTRAIREEASLRTQLYVGGLAIALLAAIRPPLIWIAACVIAAGFVLALEMFNTALEHLADKLHPERHEAIGVAKDCAAGAVLIASITAVIIGTLTLCVSLGLLKP